MTSNFHSKNYDQKSKHPKEFGPPQGEGCGLHQSDYINLISCLEEGARDLKLNIDNVIKK